MQTEQIIKTAEEKLIHTYNRYLLPLGTYFAFVFIEL